MDDLNTLEQLIQERLAAVQARRRERRQLLGHKMAESEERTRRFEETSRHLMELVVRPRVSKLAELFPNAKVLHGGAAAGQHCTCRFEHTVDYPASTKLDFGLSLDDAVGSIIVTYSLEILPVFFQFDGHDQIVVPLSAVDDESIASWIDAKLLAFTDTYLQLPFIEQYQQENVVVDPVCGMSIDRAAAGATFEYGGRTYYFCVDECCNKFKQDPDRYVARYV